MTNYNDGLWYGWNGGECPVHPETKIVVQLACDRRVDIDRNAAMAVVNAGLMRWSSIGSGGDIISFRVIKEHKEPREVWGDGSSFWYNKEEAEKYCEGNVGLFREVLE